MEFPGRTAGTGRDAERAGEGVCGQWPESQSGGETFLLKARNYQNLRPGSPLEIEVEGGDVLFRRLKVYPLRSIH
jgi:hypothetical protein